MASSIQDTHNVHHLSLAVSVFTFLIGIVTQLFIVVVNTTDWMKGKPKTPIDQLLTSLGITRIFLHFFCFLNAMCMTFLRSYMGSGLQIFLDFTANSSNLSDIWLGTLFSVIFCMKICNFQNAFSLYVRRLISHKVVHLIAILVFMSICFLSIFEIIDGIINPDFWLQNFTSNETRIPEETHVYIFITMGNSIPFFIYSTSSLLLIVSLCVHLNKMKSNSNVSANLTSYYKAIQFMTTCLIGFMLRIGSNIIVLCFYFSMDSFWLFIILNSAAILNSIYLIYRTNKLSNRFLKILYGANCIFHRRGSVSNCGDQEETTTSF